MGTNQPSYAHIKIHASNLPIPNKYKTLKDTRAKETAPTFPKPQKENTIVTETETPEVKIINHLHIYIDKENKYPPELIDDIISHLTTEDFSWLEYTFKGDFYTPETIPLNRPDYEKFRRVIRIIRSKLKNSKSFKEIVDDEGIHSLEEIETIMKTLSPSNQELIESMFGSDYTKKIYFYNAPIRQYHNIVYRVKELLLINTQSFYECVDKNKRLKQKEINLIVEAHTFKERKILLIKYKNGLNKPPTTLFDVDNEKAFYSLIAELRREVNSAKTFYELINSGREKYTKKEIDTAISLLTPPYQKALKELYGEDLSNRIITANKRKKYIAEFVRKKLRKMKEDEKKKTSKTTPKQKKAKKVKSTPKSDNKEKSIKVRKAKPLYDLLKAGRNIPNEVIDELIKNLSENEKKALNDRYQNGFDKPPTEEIPKDKKAFYDGIKRKLKKQLDKFFIISDNEELESFYTLVGKHGGYTKEQIDAVFKLLTKEEQDLINERYGFDLDNPPPNKLEKSKAKKYEFLLGKIRNRLLVNALPFYIYIDKTGKYSQEIIDKVIASRSPTERASLHARYENGFDNPPTNNLDKDLIDECSRIANGIRKRLSGRKSFYEYVDKEKKYTKEDIDRAIERLNQNQRNEINTIFNNNLSQPTLVEGKKNQSRLSYLVKRINTILNESEKKPDFVSIIIYIPEVIEIAKTSNNASSNSIDEFLNKVPTSEISNILDDTEAAILYRIYNKKGNYAEISRDLNMSEQEIKKIEHSALTKISNYIKTITGVDEDSNNPQETSSNKQLKKNRLN